MNWFGQLFSRRRRYHELSESIREHLDETIEELMDKGASREEAARAARSQFGNVALVEERGREVWQWPTVESVWADLKYALRQLRKHLLFPRSNPIGHQLGDPKRSYTIVGVAKDSKDIRVNEHAVAMAYFPYTQVEGAPSTLQVEARTSGSPLALLPSITKAVQEIDPNLPLERPMTELAVFQDSYLQQRLLSKLALCLGLLATLLVALGLYGTLSYRVSRRPEIGVRMALGAQRSQVLFLVVRESLRIAAVGVAFGVPLAFLAGYLVRSMLFGLTPYDWLSFVIAFICVAGIGVMAGWVPAQQAASIDPMQALRNE